MLKFIIHILLILLVTTERDYTLPVQLLQNAIQSTQFKHKAYQRLAYLTDTYGPRMWGSSTLQLAIEEVRKMAIEVGFDNIHLQPVVNFTRWVRGKESLILHSPRKNPTALQVIGIGGTVSGNITADVVVVSDWDDLDRKQEQVMGKIVCYNFQWINYSSSIDYRYSGASRAARYGAVAALVRSVTPKSIASVHTGNMHYDDNYTKIPVAAITLQDAAMFKRMQDRGQTITVELSLNSDNYPNCCNSSNLIFEIQGTQKPQQIILMGGHIDTWDTGSQTGANDDGGGFFTVFQALRMLKLNNFIPRRTLRFIAWSGQQWGGYYNNGAQQYYKTHLHEIDNHIVAFESDSGTTQLLGFGYSGSDHGMEVVKYISDNYLVRINMTKISTDGTNPDTGVEINIAEVVSAIQIRLDTIDATSTGVLFNAGVPVMDVCVQDTPDREFYFTYHHSRGDTMSIMDADSMDSNVLGIAVMFYILADLENTIR